MGPLMCWVQLVIYPVLDLRRCLHHSHDLHCLTLSSSESQYCVRGRLATPMDIGWYLDAVHNAIIHTAAEHGVPGGCRKDHGVGVWLSEAAGAHKLTK